MSQEKEILVKTRWMKDDLHGKKVQFRIEMPDGVIISGVGDFIFRERPDKFQEIIIQSPSTQDYFDPNGYWNRVTLNQRLADKIQRSPENEPWEFVCLDDQTH
jgi:hypothetical protein